jgi:hypothetical protein
VNPFEPPTAEQRQKATRPGLQVAGGMTMGCGFLMIAAGAVFVASAYATRCPSDSIACGESQVYSVIAAVSAFVIGGTVAFIGWLLYRSKRQS